MIPDFEKMNERMEQASLKELMPGFDREQEWQQLSARLHPQKKKIAMPVWSYAAAILLLLACGGLLTWLLSGAGDRQAIAQRPAPVHKDVAIIVATGKEPVRTDTSLTNAQEKTKVALPQNEIIAGKDKIPVATKRRPPIHKGYHSLRNYKTEDIICNGTPCPIQICISQTMKCPDIQPSAISSCSTLEPDQSGQLRYKAHDKIAKNCSLTVDEIEITSIATGETILLNANSSPSTAQEVFSYITGQKKGDILTGMFNSDCDHRTKKHGVRLDNSYGNLIIQ